MIARVMHGGAADRSGLIHAGDEVIEVNGISVENKTPADVLDILVSQTIVIYDNNSPFVVCREVVMLYIVVLVSLFLIYLTDDRLAHSM